MGGALSSWFVPAPSASSLRTTSHLCSGSSTALQARYQELAAQLPQRGFEESALQHARESFALGADGSWRPRRYDEAPWSLPPNAVRVLALSISDAQLNGASRSVGEAALRAAADLARQLPAHPLTLDLTLAVAVAVAVALTRTRTLALALNLTRRWAH